MCDLQEFPLFAALSSQIPQLESKFLQCSSFTLAGDHFCDLRFLHQSVGFGRNRSGVTTALVCLSIRCAMRQTLGNEIDEVLLLEGQGHRV